jgi:hypothetical protein
VTGTPAKESAMHRIVCGMLVVMLAALLSSEQGATAERGGRGLGQARQAAKLYELKPRPQDAQEPRLLSFPTYRTRAHFASDEDYGKYVRATLTIGMRVRACVDYERVKKGMRGIYFGTNDGTPPCLVMWDDDLKSSSVLIDLFPRGKGSHAYWVFWHQVDLNLD